MTKLVVVLFRLSVFLSTSFGTSFIHAFVIPSAPRSKGAKPMTTATTTTTTTMTTMMMIEGASDVLLHNNGIGEIISSLDLGSAAETSFSSFSSFMMAEEEAVSSYSQISYYTILALYVMSFPGLWSQIKRSTSAKVKRKTFVSAGENAASDGKDLRQQAGEIMAYMKANNYEVIEAGETITFRGVVQRSLSQAFFLVFCTSLGLASLALVLQIQFQNLEIPIIGQPNWYFLVLLSPYAGIYYWNAGDRVDDCEVRLASNDDDTENEITIQGSEEELERMWRTLGWQEKGMVKVDGILDSL